MLNSIDFKKCIADNLKGRRYEHKRIKDITDAFDKRVVYHKANGMGDLEANIVAMRDTFDGLTNEAVERAKRTSKMLAVAADNNERIAQGKSVQTSVLLNDGTSRLKGSKGTGMARAAISMIEDDPRFEGLSYSTRRETYRGQFLAIFGDVLQRLGKGAFGRQKGAAHAPNIMREAFGASTGDVSANEFATAWLKISDLMVDVFNNAGGSMRKLDRYIPNPGSNPAKMINREAEWVRDYEGAVDWNRTRWPDGSIIRPDERADFLKKVYATKATDGAVKIDEMAFRGNGRAVGNALKQNRLIHIKDAENWLKLHDKYGDGTVYDVFMHHIDNMAHQIALIDTFGPNPEMGASNLELAVRKQAAEEGTKELADAEAVLKNRFRPMFEQIMRQNPMDPQSLLGNTIVSTSNVLTSAQLASASLLAIPGDFVQTAVVRAYNNMGLFEGVDRYARALVGDADEQRLAIQSGFVADQVVGLTYAVQRFSGVATHGPAITKRVSDVILRASLLGGHTDAARWAPQAEFMGLLARMRSKGFSELPFSRVLQRYGIGPAEWDAFRNGVQLHSPAAGVYFMRPIDLLSTDVANKQQLYNMFQGMIFEESRKMVPESTIEASVVLKDTSRPDTLVGAILHSFAMYKNFPVSFQMIYGRLGVTSPNVRGRMAFYAGLGASMTLVGALGTQMREIAQGRDPIPMNSAAFLGKAFLSGGAMSIWGDFLFGGVNGNGATPKDIVGGPLAQLLGDTSQLALGDVFRWAESVGTLGDKDFQSSTAAKAVEFASRYTPGTTLWWARLALQRHVFDRLREIADPNIYRKRQQQMKRQADTFGNDYWWKPGTRTPQRAPAYGG